VVKAEDVEEILEEIILDIKEGGHSPYVAPIGGSMVGGSMEKPLGAISYVSAFVEMLEQAEAHGFEMDYVIHASGSGGTQAGLAVAAKALKGGTKVLGISVSDDKETFGKDVLTVDKDTVNALGLDLEIDKEDIIVFDEYIGEGYGIINKEVSDTIRFAAKKEGVFLDPVYTGRAMLALFDLIKKGYFKKEDKVVFCHTGGTPALFPNKANLYKFLR